MAYSAELYVHDLDRQAADALNQFPKFVKLLESYSANYDEKAAKIDLLSTAIRLGENQMPEVYGLLPPICEQLGIDTPELYYVRDKRANAATFGSVHPCIYVTSGNFRSICSPVFWRTNAATLPASIPFITPLQRSWLVV